MERRGVEVTTVNDGGDAIAALERGQTFALILLDIMMPRVNGFDVFRWMSEHEVHMPVIVMTAGDTVLSRIDVSVVAATIQKPFDLDRLAALASDLCGLPAPGDAAADKPQRPAPETDELTGTR